MKKLAAKIFIGKDDKISGMIAFAIVALIAFGCSCGDKFDLSKFANINDSNRTAVNTSKDNPFGDDDKSSDDIPADSVIQSMVKDTTADFTNAIDTGNFGPLYEKSSSDFQSTFTEDQLKVQFLSFIINKKRVLPSLNKAQETTAVFSPSPSIRTENGLSILVVNGKFPSKPFPVKFEYEYVKRDGEWKMLKLVINM